MQEVSEKYHDLQKTQDFNPAQVVKDLIDYLDYDMEKREKIVKERLPGHLQKRINKYASVSPESSSIISAEQNVADPQQPKNKLSI